MQHTTPFGTPPGTILIADDEELIRRVLADTLRDQGHTVQTVDNGALAWEALTTKAFDLALLDIRMPERTGLDILLQAQQEPRTDRRPHTADHHHDRPDHPR